MAHLLREGAAVTPVLADRNGETAVTGSGGLYEVHAIGVGDDRYRDTPSWTPLYQEAEAFAVGVALAQLHVAGARYLAPYRQTRCLVAGDFIARAGDPLGAIAKWVDQDPCLRGALAGRRWQEDFYRVLRPLYAALQPYVTMLKPAWVHGDFHASNLLWQGGDVTAVLDFGLCNRASALFDLATAIERNAISWLELSGRNTNVGDARVAGAMIDGYGSVTPLSTNERRALRYLLPVVHVEFALGELSYFHGVTRSERDGELAYSAFLLGHPAWFGSEDGLSFLERIPG